MAKRPPVSRRRGATLLAIAVVVAAGASACAVARPSPERHGPEAHFRGQGADRGSQTRVANQLLLRLGERRLYLIHDDPERPAESFPIAIGRTGWETPLGKFRVEEMVEHPEFIKLDPDVPSRVLKHIPPGPANPLGERWIGFAHGEGWTVGIHGTPNPELLGHAVSHGCVRMRNADVVRVYERVQLGTPVVVQP